MLLQVQQISVSFHMCFTFSRRFYHYLAIIHSKKYATPRRSILFMNEFESRKRELNFWVARILISSVAIIHRIPKRFLRDNNIF